GEVLLIAADARGERCVGVIFPLLGGQSGFDELQSVLELRAGVPVGLVLPGHGRSFADVRGALDRAFTRLEAMRADPRRHARHALKVLVKFLLLDLERVEAARLVEPLRRAAVMQRTAELIGMDFGAALAWAADELVAQGQLRRDGAWLVNG